MNKDRIQQVISGVFTSHEGRDVTPKRIADYLKSMQTAEEKKSENDKDLMTAEEIENYSELEFKTDTINLGS